MQMQFVWQEHLENVHVGSVTVSVCLLVLVAAESSLLYVTYIQVHSGIIATQPLTFAAL